jgi:hypothetical protein
MSKKEEKKDIIIFFIVVKFYTSPKIPCALLEVAQFLIEGSNIISSFVIS